MGSEIDAWTRDRMFADTRPWEGKKHRCHRLTKVKYAVAPDKTTQSMVVGCPLCKATWPHPNGRDMFVAYAAGYRAARLHMSDAVDQLSVFALGFK